MRWLLTRNTLRFTGAKNQGRAANADSRTSEFRQLGMSVNNLFGNIRDFERYYLAVTNAYNRQTVRLSLPHIRRLSRPIARALALLMLVFPLGSHAAGTVLCLEADGSVAIEDAVGFGCGSIVVERSSGNHSDIEVGAAENASSHCGACVDVFLPSGADKDCASFKPDTQPTVEHVATVVAVLLLDDSHQVRAVAGNIKTNEYLQFHSLAPVRSTQLLI